MDSEWVFSLIASGYLKLTAAEICAPSGYLNQYGKLAGMGGTISEWVFEDDRVGIASGYLRLAGWNVFLAFVFLY